MVPLFQYKLLLLRADVQRLVPDWGAIGISGFTKYLGFMLGPEKKLESYKKPLIKYKERAALWARQALGLHLSLRVYSVFIASVLGFVTQLEPLPDKLFNEAELYACRRLFSGPHCWIVPNVLHVLKELGSNICLQDVRATSVAARSLVFRASREGGESLRRREKRLRQVIDGSSVSHCLWLGSWAKSNFFSSVVDADLQVDAMIALRRARGTLPAAFASYIEPMGPDFGDDGRYRKWQPVATALLHPTSLKITTAHMDARLRKLNLNTLPGHRLRRATRILRELYSLTASRVVAAVLRCFLDGWITQRRLLGARNCPCKFGCKKGTDDLNHIMRCPMTHLLARKHLQLRPPPVDQRADAFLCMDEDLLNSRYLLSANADRDGVLRARGILMFALYSVHNALRHRHITTAGLDGAFAQSCRNARLAFRAEDD